MNRSLTAVCGALASVTLLMPAVGASRFSDWSTPVNLGATINTTFGDEHPAISKDGLSLYFQSGRPGGYGGIDIYVAHRDATGLPWDPPRNLGPVINTASLEVTPALSRDGHYLFFASPRATGSADVFVSYRPDVHDDFGWESPIMLGSGINSVFGDTGPSFFENDDYGLPQLYFNSARPSGLGSSDIYVAGMNTSGEFAPAVLVRELSSPQNDVTADIFRNGTEIFLQSDRLGGVGGADLWMSTRESPLDPWSAPHNMGTIVNSIATDGGPSIASDGETLFFYSTRLGGQGAGDLYMTTRVKR